MLKFISCYLEIDKKDVNKIMTIAYGNIPFLVTRISKRRFFKRTILCRAHGSEEGLSCFLMRAMLLGINLVNVRTSFYKK